MFPEESIATLLPLSELFDQSRSHKIAPSGAYLMIGIAKQAGLRGPKLELEPTTTALPEESTATEDAVSLYGPPHVLLIRNVGVGLAVAGIANAVEDNRMRQTTTIVSVGLRAMET